MEHEAAAQPTAVVAQRVREVRRRRDLTAQQLADRLQGAGISWDRATVTKLETGRRQNVTLIEVLALAHVLGVAPVHLVVPLDERPFQVTSGGKTPEGETVPPVIEETGRVREWIRGVQPLPGTDLRTFRAEVPLDELTGGRTPEQLGAKRELFDRMGSWGAVDVEAEKDRDPGPWREGDADA